MKSFEMQPTDENILQSLENDLLSRNIDVCHFVDLLNSIDSSCSIALDAPWGAGKTFFVKQVKMVLDAFNEHIDEYGDDERQRVRTVWGQTRTGNKPELLPQVSVYYDAWINDNDEDPILSLVYSILQSVSTDFKFNKSSDLLSVAASIIETFTERPITAIREALRSEDPMSKIRSAKNMQERILEFLHSLLPERGNRLVVFVDELDRCNPAFAVKLLERIKHYFSNDDITFVFSVNIGELQHTVRSYYGSEFDASRYLDRFFDLRIDLPPARLDRFYQEIGLKYGTYTFENVCKTIIEKNQFTLREIAKFYRMARTAVYQPTHDSKRYEFVFPEERATQFCLMFLVPVMIGLKISNHSKYIAFITGKDSSPLHDVLDGTDIGIGLRNYLLANNETFDENNKKEGVTLVKLKDRIERLYNALFIHQYTLREYEIPIGQMSFGNETHDELLRTVSALSEYADFEV